MDEVGAVLERLNSREASLMTVDKFRDLVEKLVVCCDRAAAIGGALGAKVRASAQSALDVMHAGAGMAGIPAEAKPLLQKALEAHRAPLPVPELMLQISRPDSPIEKNEILACLALEEHETFVAMLQILDGDQRAVVVETARTLKMAIDHGLSIPDVDQKVAYIGSVLEKVGASGGA